MRHGSCRQDRPVWLARLARRARVVLAIGLYLVLGLVLSCRRPEPTVVPPPRPEMSLPPVPASPPAPPPPRRVVPPSSPPAPQSAVTIPATIRVGLATDLDAVSLPCCDRRVVLRAGDFAEPLTVSWRIEPAGSLADRAVYRLQVAALKDEQQARGIATYLERESGLAADAVFDAGTDLYKVRCGRFATRQEAEAARQRLAGFGVTEGWVVSEGGTLERAALRLARGAETKVVSGRWLTATAAEGAGISFRGVRYRGSLHIYLNDRGRLNVINELSLEDYLRGVVPKEMGPELYGEIEALKAQAVAARTYTLRNLGEFADEGYDICSTPRCQVYGGMNIEHPLSDRAIGETVGQVVLFGGEPTETFYSSTCGGHTENVEVIFPLKRGAYLKGVPCIEGGEGKLLGNVLAGTPFPGDLAQELLPPSAGRPQRVLNARIEHLALLAGLPVPRDRLRSLSHREILRFVASVFDLALDRRLITSPRELAELVTRPPADWQARELSFAGFLAASAWLTPSVIAERASGVEIEELLWRLATYLGLVREERLSYLGFSHGELLARRGGERVSYALPGALATFRRQGNTLVAGPLELLASDEVDLYWHHDRLLAAIQPHEPRAVDVRAPRQRWSRFVTRSDLRQVVQLRYPGFPFEGFEVLARGVSGRVGKLRLLGARGRSVEVEGLAVRWTLDLPDTWFQAEPQTPQGRSAGWLFRGRGWGHGVGMCQVGSVAMAKRGRSYRDILEHYYTGIEIRRLAIEPPKTASVMTAVAAR